MTNPLQFDSLSAHYTMVYPRSRLALLSVRLQPTFLNEKKSQLPMVLDRALREICALHALENVLDDCLRAQALGNGSQCRDTARQPKQSRASS